MNKNKIVYCNCVLQFVFLFFVVLVSRFVTVSVLNQCSDDAFSSCDFEHRIVFACNQLNDDESGTVVCGRFTAARNMCVKDLCWKLVSHD